MRKALILIGILLLGGLAATTYAQTNDAPHNVTNSISCGDCHTLYPPGVYDDGMCTQCHDTILPPYSKMNAPMVATHSSANTSTKYGTWTRTCKDCHYRQSAGIHGQLQLRAFTTETYLVTGTITSVTSNPDGTRTYGYNNLVENMNVPGWGDPTKWGKKSANANGGTGRGLIFYKTPPSTTTDPVASEVISATANTLTVTGNPGAVTVGNTFALIYGQFVRSSIVGAGNANREVRFFSNTGQNSFAYDESATGTDPTPNGVCQVCHTQTTHWRASGTLAGVGVHAGQNGANCMTCHKHEEGFKASGCDSCHGNPPIDTTNGGPSGLVVNTLATGSTTAGAHAKHTAVGFNCASCHYNSVGSGVTHNDGSLHAVTLGFNLYGGNYNGQTTVDYNTTTTTPPTTVTSPGSGAMQCSNLYCHSNAKVGTSAVQYATPAWNGSALNCSSCHGYPPQYANGGAGTATANSHVPHVTNNDFGCELCHNATTTNGTTITNTAMHVNGAINIAFDATNPSGVYAAGTKTCSTTVCHGAGTPQWGGTVKCQDCHLAASDVDDFSGTFYDNNITATIMTSEWNSTGHGATAAYTSGNPAAGFTVADACLYCHDDTIAHGTAANPFRLKNFVDAEWGKNGNCQSCHASGAAGVTVNSVLKNGTKKIASTHYDNKHVAGGGGQFCWDCHDPHGDTNIFMVHASVAKTSDATTGAPTVSVPTTFIAFATGTDYAQSAAPFTGICNVCHTNTNHYTASSGDGHNSGTRCTDCHQHSNDTMINAFRPSGCDTCHGNPPITNSTIPTPAGVPNNGLVNTPAPTGATTFGMHPKHAMTGLGAYGYSCEKCHAGGMPASAIPNMKIEIGFNISPAYQTGTYDGRTLQPTNPYTYIAGNAGTTITNTGEQSCNNIYCHSNAKVGTSVQDYSKVFWANGSLTCTACHGFPPSYASGAAGSATANSHEIHVSDNNFGCQVCHSRTLSADGSIIVVSVHANAAIDVNFDASSPSGSYNSAAKTCSAVSCHGSGTPQWGGSVSCQSCHLGAADNENFSGTFWNNGTAGVIGSGEWTSTGHGRSAGNYTSGNTPAGFTTPNACLFCHDDTITHNTASNPFRLRNINDALWGKNGNCQLCHVAGSVGVTVDGVLKNSTSKVGSTHYGTKHNVTANGGQFCWDCHDPHGDNNIFMVHAMVAKTSSATTGAPLTTAMASFTAFGTGTDYAGGANSIRICNTCHTSTSHYTSTTSDTHNATIRCTNCHKHTDDAGTITAGFKPFGDNCYDCHSSAGGPTPGTTSDSYHARHIKTAFVGKVSLGDYGNSAKGWYFYSNTDGVPDMGCGYCHPQSSTTHMNGVVNLNFSPTDSGAAGTLKAKNAATPVFSQNSRVSVTCSSVYCHSNGYDPGTGYGYQTSDNWYTATVTGDVCAKCHGNSPNSSRPGSPAHGKHVVGIHYKTIFTGTEGLATAGTSTVSSHGNATTSTTINCNICHNATVTTSGNDANTVCATCHTGSTRIMTIAAGSTSHVNGVVDVMFAGTMFRSKAQIRDDITTVPELDSNWTRINGYKAAGSNDMTVSALNSSGYAGGNCTVSCHNGFTVQWNSIVTCISCHTDLP